MRVKKSTRVRKSRRVRKSSFARSFARVKKSSLAKRFARVKKSIHLRREVGATAIVAAVFCVAAGAMLIAVLQAREPANGLTANSRSRILPTEVHLIDTPDSANSTVAPEPASKAAAEQSPVTVTGCLEMNNETFRLKNTSGTDAPKARSWKSGFLKKNPASIQVVDAANRVQLPNHVGQRVVVTGTIVDREMQVRSLRRVATSCNQEA
jgi:hypothetical protein